MLLSLIVGCEDGRDKLATSSFSGSLVSRAESMRKEWICVFVCPRMRMYVGKTFCVAEPFLDAPFCSSASERVSILKCQDFCLFFGCSENHKTQTLGVGADVRWIG